MKWLPPSTESRQLLKLGAITLAVSFALITVLHFSSSRKLRRAEAEHALRDQATVFAAVLNHSPELTRTHELLVALAADTAQVAIPMEGFIVAGADEVRASARSLEEKTPWEGVQARLHAVWPKMLLVQVPLHRDPNRPGKETGQLYLAAPFTPDNRLVPSLRVAALGCGLLLLLALPMFYVLNRNWFIPLHRITQANRSTLEGRTSYQLLPSQVAPPGEIREIIFHRNHVLETLKQREEGLSRRSHDMEALYEFARALGQTRDLADIPPMALTQMAPSVPYDVGCMVLFSDDTHTMWMRSGVPLGESSLAEVERLAVEAYYERSAVQMAGEKLDVILQVVDPRAQVLDTRFRSWYWSVVTSDARAIGVVGCLGLRDRQFHADAMRFVNFMALAISLAFKRQSGLRIEGKI